MKKLNITEYKGFNDDKGKNESETPITKVKLTTKISAKEIQDLLTRKCTKKG